jgi:DNA invertase Pin-like site-specific DNA recombinase
MNHPRPPLIGLVRVSTERQADSGLGLAAQLAAIEQYRQSIDGDLIETYREVESGTHRDIENRPRLREAARHAVDVGGVLVIAKLDRLVRSTSVMQCLKDAKVKFVACDNPHANEFTIDILVAVAANEARAISQRTKDALKAYRDHRRVSRRISLMYPRGVPPEVLDATAGKLGGSLPQCRNLTAEGRARGNARSKEVRTAEAQRFAEGIGRLVKEWRSREPGLSLHAIAVRLNAERRKTPRGKAWTPRQVSRVLARLKPA